MQVCEEKTQISVFDHWQWTKGKAINNDQWTSYPPWIESVKVVIMRARFFLIYDIWRDFGLKTNNLCILLQAGFPFVYGYVFVFLCMCFNVCVYVFQCLCLCVSMHVSMCFNSCVYLCLFAWIRLSLFSICIFQICPQGPLVPLPGFTSSPCNFPSTSIQIPKYST